MLKTRTKQTKRAFYYAGRALPHWNDVKLNPLEEKCVVQHYPMRTYHLRKRETKQT